MEILELPVKSIKPYKNNPRHNDKAVEFVANSLREFGWKQPIVIDEQYEIVAGHTRWKAAKMLGMETVPCVMADDLTPEQVQAYRLADNKTAEMADWDFELLEQELNDIDPAMFDMADFGFFQGEAPEPENKESREVEEDDFNPDAEAEARCKRGQVWRLGNHRLMCGDSTSEYDASKLMNGEIADIAFASPPYNAGFGANLTKDNGRSKYTNGDDDNKSADEYEHFLNNYIDIASKFSQFNFVNIQMLSNNKRALFRSLYKHLDTLADIVIWDKTRSQPSLAYNVLNSEFEFVFCFSNKGNRAIGTIPFHGNLKNIIHIAPGHNEYADIHNAVFPIAFPAHFIQNFCENTCLDLFGGTGTTLIACEQLDRCCYMMELDPHYCDVIIKRWEDFTGKKAELVEE